jgi:hypothetical protein
MRNPPTLPEILIRTPWLLAIGQALRAGYAEMGESVPERLAALVKKLEGPPSSVRATGDGEATAKTSVSQASTRSWGRRFGVGKVEMIFLRLSPSDKIISNRSGASALNGPLHEGGG